MFLRKGYLFYVFVFLIGMSLTVAAAYATTTISTDVLTGGNIYATSSLAVTGAITGYSTLTIAGAINASSTLATSGNITVPAGYAFDTAAAGVLNIGTSTATTINIGQPSQVVALLGNATVAGTLGVTGATSLRTLTVANQLYASSTIMESTTATSTAVFTSSSGTQGFCLQFNATSTNTLLNMTFAASTTAQTTVGVAPIVRYGACN